jgi:putative cell wall-binding protein
LSIRTKRSTKRSVAALVAATLIASVLALVSAPASATATVTQKRLSGLDRYATASAVAEYTYGTSTKAIIASGDNYADALTGSALSGAIASPLLLTAKDALPAVTAAALGRMMGTNKTVYVLGGEAAVSAGVVTTLTGLGYVVTRVSGADRYATAAAVAAKIVSLSTIGSLNGKVTCILASGQGYADALSAGPLAHNNIMPILLTEPGTLTAATSAAITANGCKQMMIVGGESAVSAAVATAADALTGVNVIRVSGADRYATSVAIADKAWASLATGGLAWAKTHIAIARGDSYADGLAASQLGAKTAVTPLLLVQADMVPTVVAASILAKATTLAHIRVVGGLTAIPATVAQSADDSATKAAPSVTISGNTLGSNAVTVSYSTKMDNCKDRGDYTLNNAALATTATATAAGQADAAAPFAGEAVALSFADAALNVLKNPGNKVTLAAQNAAGDFVADLTYGTQAAGVTEQGYVMGVGDTAVKVWVLGTTTATAATTTVGPATDQDLGLVAATQTTTCVIYLAAPLAAGDVFTASGAQGYLTPNVLATAASSTTAAVANVAANKPTATVTCYSGAGFDSILVDFNKPVQGFIYTDVSVGGPGVAETLAAADIQAITGAQRYRLLMNGAMEAGDTITVAADSVTAQDGTTGPAVAAVGTCVSNTTKPTVVSATGVSTVTGSATCSSADLAEDFVYTFNKTGIGAGILGDAYTIDLVNSASGTTAVTTSYNALTKTSIVSWNDSGTATEASVTAIVAAINADATLGANGTAVVSDSSNGVTMTAGASINCAAGTTTVAVTATMNAPYQPAASDILHTGVNLVDGTGLVKLAMTADGVVTGTWNANAYAGTFKWTFTLTLATQSLVKGTSKIEFAANSIMSLNDVLNLKSSVVIN